MDAQLQLQFMPATGSQSSALKVLKADSSELADARAAKGRDSFAKTFHRVVEKSAQSAQCLREKSLSNERDNLQAARKPEVHAQDPRENSKTGGKEQDAAVKPAADKQVKDKSELDDDKKKQTESAAEAMALLQNLLALLQQAMPPADQAALANGGEAADLGQAAQASAIDGSVGSSSTEDIKKLMLQIKLKLNGEGSAEGSKQNRSVKSNGMDTQSIDKLQELMDKLAVVAEAVGNKDAGNTSLSGKLLDAAGELARLRLAINELPAQDQKNSSIDKAALAANGKDSAITDPQKSSLAEVAGKAAGLSAKTEENVKQSPDGKTVISSLSGKEGANSVDAEGSSGNGKGKNEDGASKEQVVIKHEVKTDSGSGLFKFEQTSVLGGSKASENAQPQTPALETNDIIAQMKDKISFDKLKNMQEVKMKLNPEALGELKIHLSIINGSVEAKFIADSNSVRQSLEANMDGLKKQLEDQGIQVQKLSVSVGGSFDSRQFQQQGQQWAWQQNSAGNNARYSEATYGDRGFADEDMEENGRQADLASLAYGSNVSYAI